LFLECQHKYDSWRKYFFIHSIDIDRVTHNDAARDIDNTTVLYDHNKLNAESNHLTRVKNLSEELVNLKVLKELY